MQCTVCLHVICANTKTDVIRNGCPSLHIAVHRKGPNISSIPRSSLIVSSFGETRKERHKWNIHCFPPKSVHVRGVRLMCQSPPVPAIIYQAKRLFLCTAADWNTSATQSLYEHVLFLFHFSITSKCVSSSTTDQSEHRRVYNNVRSRYVHVLLMFSTI